MARSLFRKRSAISGVRSQMAWAPLTLPGLPTSGKGGVCWPSCRSGHAVEVRLSSSALVPHV